MKTRRCYGTKGVWHCADRYPDHVLPITEFTGVRTTCKTCRQVANLAHNAKISRAERFVGSRKEFRSMTRDERSEVYDQLSKDVEDWTSIQTAITPKKPKRSPIARMRQWVGGKMEGEIVPEGWVYAIRNKDAPELIKIGRTYPEGLEGRLSEAQRWGRYEIVGQYWFDDVNYAEKCIHAKMAKWNLRNQGETEVGTEVFKTTLNNFQRAAADHISDLMEATGAPV